MEKFVLATHSEIVKILEQKLVRDLAVEIADLCIANRDAHMAPGRLSRLPDRHTKRHGYPRTWGSGDVAWVRPGPRVRYVDASEPGNLVQRVL